MMNTEKLCEARRRLMARRIIDDAGCWRYVNRKGEMPNRYVKLLIDGELDGAHRWSYRAFVGPIPEGQLIRHACDTPGCWNPAHLSTGTQAQNINDAVLRGRTATNRGGAKLSADQLRAIIETPRYFGMVNDLAVAYGVHRTTITNVLHGRTWGGV